MQRIIFDYIDLIHLREINNKQNTMHFIGFNNKNYCRLLNDIHYAFITENSNKVTYHCHNHVLQKS